jgi:hypothetical protein
MLNNPTIRLLTTQIEKNYLLFEKMEEKKEKSINLMVISDNLYNYFELFKDIKIGDYNLVVDQSPWDKSKFFLI